MRQVQSWGLLYSKETSISSFNWRDERLPKLADSKNLLPLGLARSYGDSCLNDGGVLVDATSLNRFIEFDAASGLLTCEGGISFREILSLAVPRGWFLPVSPGTKFITLGGAIANDIHGKNHHRAGTFGCHVLEFELLRSNGERLTCSLAHNQELFCATIGGLGLTGLILWAKIQMKPITGSFIDLTTEPFSNIKGFFELSQTYDGKSEYTVSWLDLTARGKHLGRGIFMAGNHSQKNQTLKVFGRDPKISVPCDAPTFLLNDFTIKEFNNTYFRKHGRAIEDKVVNYDSFFYPLDAVGNWNRLYGKPGFFQYQCVIPPKDALENMRAILTTIGESGESSFLSVFKAFGNKASPGLLSFPQEGYTVAFDLPNRGNKTLALMNDLDSIVAKVGGRVYPAKDARMSAGHFKQFFPQWKELENFRDPQFSSNFWRRVTNS